MNRASSKVDMAEDYCFLCKDGGELRICDYKDCLKAYHPLCVGRDDSFLDIDERWTCSWHSCSCGKSATFQCFCCPTSFCVACIRNAEFGSAKDNMKGFCNGCLKLAIKIEENIGVNSDGNNADLEDTEIYEILFKDYWVIIKEQEGLTSIDLQAAVAHLKNRENIVIESDSEDELPSEDDEIEKSYDDGILNLDDIKVPQNGVKDKHKWSRLKKKNFVGWGSEELIQFLTSIGKSAGQPLSQLDACEIVKAYIVKNNLVDPDKKKKKVHCDERLYYLFRKKSVKLHKIFTLLESHLAENQESDEELSLSLDVDHDDLVASKRLRKETHDFNNRNSGLKGNTLFSHTPQSLHAAIVEKNIQSVYLTRSLMLELLKNPETLEHKIVGCFVRVKSDPKDFCYSPGKVYRLGQVLGVKKSKEEYKLGDTRLDIVLQVSNMFKDIQLNMLSDDNFEEEECQDLRLLVQKGFMKRPTVADLEKKVRIIHEDITNHWIAKEITKLQKQIDHANEKGWRKELFEYIERRDLLRKPAERLRLLEEFPEIIVDAELDAGKSLNIQENKKGTKVSGCGGRLDIENGIASEVDRTRKVAAYSFDAPQQLEKGAKDMPDVAPHSSVVIIQDDVEEVRVELDRNGDAMKDEKVSLAASEAANIGSGHSSGAGESNNRAAAFTGGHSSVAGESNNRAAAAAPFPPTAAAAATTDPELDQVWHYMDPSGKVQGPFAMAALRYWKVVAGYFGDDFKVWRAGQSYEQAILLNVALGYSR